MYLLVSLALAISQGALVHAKGDQKDSMESEEVPRRIVLAHGVLMAVVFAVLFPLGAIILRAAHLPHIAWWHGGWQVVSYLGALAGLGLGAWIATVKDQWAASNGHPILGTIVVGLLLSQPLDGYLHHRRIQRGKPPSVGITHKWTGRVLLVLGIIDGGLGLQLAHEDNRFIIPYSVVSGILCLAWLGGVFLGDRKTKQRKSSAEFDSSA